MKNKFKITASFICAAAVMTASIPTVGATALEAPPITDYTITIPATLSVGNAGWNELTGGIKASGTLEKGKKLVVSAASENSWNLVANKGTDNESKVGYNLAATGDSTSTYNATAEVPSWEFDSLTTEGTTQAAGIIVEDYSNKPAGTYQDVVTFTASLENSAVPVTGIKLDRSSALLFTDNDSSTVTLNATVLPDDATDKTVTWKSSDPNVATVDDSGRVKAVATGSATITAAAGDYTASCQISVNMVTIKSTDYPFKNVNTTNFDTINTDFVTIKFDNKNESCANIHDPDGWYFYGNNATTTVTAANGYMIEKVKFYTRNGSAEITDAPFTVYSYDYYDFETYTGPDHTGVNLGGWGVNKIEVYLMKAPPS